MNSQPPHITVCICTFQRPAMLARLLHALHGQTTIGAFGYSIVVADNDATGSAQSVIAEFREQSSLSIVYCIEPRQNIALARNAALRHATGDYVAFIDDDEFPGDDWLLRLLTCCDRYSASGILGPVRPHFDEEPPTWIVKGRFCDRPEHATGHVMHWKNSRTGNLLLRRSLVSDEEQPFREKFETGGEDVDFFMRMSQEGHIFRWCNEAVVYESVPPARCTRAFMLKRGLLRGKHTLNYQNRRKVPLVATSLIAVPVYTMLLPFTLLFGQHVFMKYCIRWCDHAGRLLATVGFNPVSTR